MREFFDTIVVGQKDMLNTKLERLVVTAIVTASLVSMVTGLVLRDSTFAIFGGMLALIDLTVAYLSGRRVKQKS